MKPSRVMLWAIAAAMCAISVGFLFYDFGSDEQPTQIAEVFNSAPAQVLEATDAETPQPEKLDVLDPAAQHSTHAIVPDAPQPSVPSTGVPTPQHAEPSVETPSPQATTPTAGSPTPQAKEPSATPTMIEASPQTSQPSAAVDPTDQSPAIVKDQLVTITSAAIVRDGPSPSAKIIGRAYAGAKARVASTESGWAQVEDPASGYKGWVESRILAPSTTTETAATDEAPDVAPDTWSEDERAATSENLLSAGKSKHSAKAKRHRAEHHHRRRKFAFRFFIRGFLR
jgi:Bacterial SH3 domain